MTAFPIYSTKTQRFGSKLHTRASISIWNSSAKPPGMRPNLNAICHRCAHTSQFVSRMVGAGVKTSKFQRRARIGSPSIIRRRGVARDESQAIGGLLQSFQAFMTNQEPIGYPSLARQGPMGYPSLVPQGPMGYPSFWPHGPMGYPIGSIFESMLVPTSRYLGALQGTE